MGNSLKTLSARACMLASDDTWMEDAAVQQLLVTSRLDGMTRVAGMPDLHPGRGYPVGAAFFSVGRLYPALVGNDIGCGMALWQTDVRTGSIKLDKLDKRLGNLDVPMDDDSMRNQAMQECCVENTVFDASLGTIGGGNHFAEIQQVDEVYDSTAFGALGMDASRWSVLVHTGSRGMGQSVLRAHVDAHGHQGLAACSSDADAYLAQHALAMRFAKCNRRLVAQRMFERLKAAAQCVLDVDHNFVEPFELDGQNGWLHRKGATPASKGAVMIPGSRGDFSYLVQPVRQCSESLFSLAHGAGRKWGRSDCKGRLERLSTPAQLARTRLGSRVICDDRQLIYEEAPQAYKRIDSVVQTLVDEGLITLVARMRPVLTYKTRGRCCE